MLERIKKILCRSDHETMTAEEREQREKEQRELHEFIEYLEKHPEVTEQFDAVIKQERKRLGWRAVVF